VLRKVVTAYLNLGMWYARNPEAEVLSIKRTGNAENWEDEKEKAEKSSAQMEPIERNLRQGKSSAPKATKEGEEDEFQY